MYRLEYIEYESKFYKINSNPYLLVFHGLKWELSQHNNKCNISSVQ